MRKSFREWIDPPGVATGPPKRVNGNAATHPDMSMSKQAKSLTAARGEADGEAGMRCQPN
jgi:hypothetical protein